MEPKGSLPHLQEPTIYPYSEPEQSSPPPTPPSHFLKIQFIILPFEPGFCTYVMLVLVTKCY